ncbi:MAG: hypothetical protein KAT68_17285 [Bacteroidales bacterium]|nr:hypothetical protein [Bacteroidales bacterium]
MIKTEHKETSDKSKPKMGDLVSYGAKAAIYLMQSDGKFVCVSSPSYEQEVGTILDIPSGSAKIWHGKITLYN